jgi:hypothetical protein
METMGNHRPFEQLRRSYLMGTPAQQVTRLRAVQDAGCEYVVLGPTTDDPRQVELIRDLIAAPVAAAAASPRA